jgi:2-polyprenyl-6-methoxyphenol hydroxylase-like FAD-dependent oxidoreductase
MDVIVVGAGPTGLTLAGDLAGAGISCMLLDRRSEESNLTRAFAVHARTLEQLDARGVADELATTGAHLSALRLFGRYKIDLGILPSRFRYVLITPQYQTERVLEERARALGAEIRMGTEVTGLQQAGDGVDVDVRGGNGSPETLRAAYVVGTDGVHSSVRQALHLPFPGKSVVRSLMLADVRLAEAPPEAVMLNAVGEAFVFLASFGDGWHRVIAWNRQDQAPDSAPVSLDEIRQATQMALGTDYGMHDPRWLSRFHSDERQVPHYRTGRVFLAGDAAHVHSPAGGQGMNTSIQDAANLGWKLAAAVKGWAPDGLLDTYHAERHPVGRQVLRGSGLLLRVAITGPRPLRAARSVLGAAATGIPPAARRLAEAVSGIGIGYPAPRGAHSLTGMRAPDVPLTGGGRLYQALRTGRFVLVTPPDHPLPPDVAALHANGLSDRLELATLGGPSRASVLVRPDAYIAWASEEQDAERRAAAIRPALTEWCGAPPAGAASPPTRASAPTA